MKIEHVTGTSIDTDTLPDVDAILMEKSKELHDLFAKYNRQLFLTGEMKATQNNTSRSGCVFYHMGSPELKNNPEELNIAIHTFFARLDGHIRGVSAGGLGIGPTQPPQVDSDK